jgi:4,5-dihydroxyphthalate decarboxylase
MNSDMSLHMTYAGGLYDRTIGLQNGDIRPAGIDLEFLHRPLEEVFARMLTLEYSASEFSFATYVVARDQQGPDMIAIPVFPSRHFRLSCVYVPTESPLKTLDDLKGRRVGLTEYQMTAFVWLRGIMEEQLGVSSESINWVTARQERLAIDIPKGTSVEIFGGSGGLIGALRNGEIDALMATKMPDGVRTGDVRRLLPDSRSQEVGYWSRTHLFPIMHCVVIGGNLYRANPWIARSLFDAFLEAKDKAIKALDDTVALPVSLPWLVEEVEATRTLMGADFWPYGFKQNREPVETLARYAHQQGLTKTRLAPEELFASELLTT